MNFAYGVIAIVGVLAAIILGFIAVAPDDIIQPRMIPVEEMVVVSELTPEPEAVEEESIDDIVMEEEMMMQETMAEEIMMKEEIEEPEPETLPMALTVSIPEGAGIPEDGQIFYDPQVIDVTIGTTVIWENLDNTVHTVTSGKPPVDADGVFDSEMMVAGDVFEFTFATAGSQDYYCIFHPWMVGTVNVS